MAFGALKGTLQVALNSIANPTTATGSVSVAVGDIILVVCAQQTALTATAASDNLGNTYTPVTAGNDAGTSTCRAFYSRVTVAGTLTGVSIAATASANNVVVIAAAIEGPFVASPLDANPAQTTADITSPFTCPATGTLAQADEAVIAWGVGTGSASWAATSPNLLAVQLATQSILKAAIGYQAVSATTSVAPAFTAAANPSDAVLGTASFMAAAAPHDLLADDVGSSSSVTSPSIGQVHALNAGDVQSASAVGSPALGQIHALLAADLASESSVSVPALAEQAADTVDDLLGDDVSSASSVTSPALGQIHALSANDVASASSVTLPTLTEAGDAVLFAESIVAQSIVSRPTLMITGQLQICCRRHLQNPVDFAISR